MNNKINILLRILGISILFLNLGAILGSAADSIVYVNTGGPHVYIDGAYKGDSNQGLFQTTLPAFTTHTLRVSGEGYNDFETTFEVVGGYMIIAAPMLPSAWEPTTSTSTSAPIETAAPTSADKYIAFYPEPTTSTPAATSSDKYMEFNSEPSGANVYYGNTLIGTTPFTYNVPSGQKITFKLPGYNDKVAYIEQLTRSPFKVYLSKSFI